MLNATRLAPTVPDCNSDTLKNPLSLPVEIGHTANPKHFLLPAPHAAPDVDLRGRPASATHAILVLCLKGLSTKYFDPGTEVVFWADRGFVSGVLTLSRLQFF